MKDIKVNGYSFNAEWAKGKSREDFTKHYKASAFTEKDEATQKKMIDEAYDIINPMVKTEEKPKK